MKKPGAEGRGDSDQPSQRAGEAASKRKPGQVSPEVSAAIGRQLRTMYDHVLKEPVPDRFLQLIAQLDAAPGGRPEAVGEEAESRAGDGKK